MSHWCRYCCSQRSNESFSGKGHRKHICRKCQSRPKAELQHIDQQDELLGFLDQSNISKKNVARLRELAVSKDQEIGELAKLVLEVALVKPHKRRRPKFLADNHPALLAKLAEAGLIYPEEEIVFADETEEDDE